MEKYTSKNYTGTGEPCIHCKFIRECCAYQMYNEKTEHYKLIKECIEQFPNRLKDNISAIYRYHTAKPKKRYVLVSRGGNEILSSSSRWGLILHIFLVYLLLGVVLMIIGGIIAGVKLIFK
ncbi:MAG: hypothetical protein J1E33_07670 [Alistipes sp.]|nr:hypothetical protein [Alistipes sp.]